MMRRTPLWQRVALGMVAAAIALGAIALSRAGLHHAVAKNPTASDRPAEESSAVRVELVQPTKGGIERQTIQPGSVIAFESADLYAKISGYLKEQGVDIGSRVKRGGVLAEIDAPELNKAVAQGKAAVDQADAQVLQSKARIATAEAERQASEASVKQAEAEVDRAAAVRAFREKQYARIKGLYDLKSIDARLVDEKLDEMEAARATEAAAHAGVLTAQAQVGAAQAKVEQAQADLVDAQAKVEVEQAGLDKAKVFVDYTKIVSPYDGVVTKRNFFRGAFIRSADQGGVAPLLGVSRTDLMRVVVQVPDRDVPFLQVGNPATVQIDALPGTQLKGQVSRQADAEDPETRTMRVEIDLPNPQGTLREGMYGRVAIRLQQVTDALTIPSSCLVGTVDEGQGEVFVARDGVAHLQTVGIGADNGLRMEILAGLTAADEVVRQHFGPLKEGMRLAPVVDDNSPTKKNGSR